MNVYIYILLYLKQITGDHSQKKKHLSNIFYKKL